MSLVDGCIRASERTNGWFCFCFSEISRNFPLIRSTGGQLRREGLERVGRLVSTPLIKYLCGAHQIHMTQNVQRFFARMAAIATQLRARGRCVRCAASAEVRVYRVQRTAYSIHSIQHKRANKQTKKSRARGEVHGDLNPDLTG